MSRMEKTINAIVAGLHEHTGADVVPTNTADRRPGYPYISYNITSSLNAKTFSRVDEVIPSTTPGFDYDVKVIRKEQPYFMLSISAYSENEAEAYDLAEKARDWFTFHGDLYFVALNIVAVNASNITDRTQQIVDDFERRYGFDVRIRAARATVKRVEGVEGHRFNSTINRPD